MENDNEGVLCYKYVVDSNYEIFVPTRGFYFNIKDGIVRSDHPRTGMWSSHILTSEEVIILSRLCKDREQVLSMQRAYIRDLLS